MLWRAAAVTFAKCVAFALMTEGGRGMRWGEREQRWIQQEKLQYGVCRHVGRHSVLYHSSSMAGPKVSVATLKDYSETCFIALYLLLNNLCIHSRLSIMPPSFSAGVGMTSHPAALLQLVMKRTLKTLGKFLISCPLLIVRRFWTLPRGKAWWVCPPYSCCSPAEKAVLAAPSPPCQILWTDCIMNFAVVSVFAPLPIHRTFKNSDTHVGFGYWYFV